MTCFASWSEMVSVLRWPDRRREDRSSFMFLARSGGVYEDDASGSRSRILSFGVGDPRATICWLPIFPVGGPTPAERAVELRERWMKTFPAAAEMLRELEKHRKRETRSVSKRASFVDALNGRYNRRGVR